MPNGTNSDIELHSIENRERGSYADHYTVYISAPPYNSDDSAREITAGSFNGNNSRGMLVRGRVDDLRKIARVLLEAADQIDAEASK